MEAQETPGNTLTLHLQNQEATIPSELFMQRGGQCRQAPSGNREQKHLGCRLSPHWSFEKLLGDPEVFRAHTPVLGH